MSFLRLQVASVRLIAHGIRAFDLRDPQGRLLPEFAPGSHINVEVFLRGGATWRSYSIVNDAATRDRYEIAVLQEEAGSGGSAYMHERVVEGDVLTATLPRNDFPLAEGARSHVLIAGGIGITPILSMARALERIGADYELHYCARSEEAATYREEVLTLAGRKVHFHFDGGVPSRGLDLRRLLEAPRTGSHVYVCGPRLMNAAVLDICRGSGWPVGAVHHESFAPPPTEAGDTEIEVTLGRSGKTVIVPADQSILDVLLEAGEEPLFDCKRGDCGVCIATVLEGVPVHRDNVLSPAERQSGREMCICVSRAATRRLVLDL